MVTLTEMMDNLKAKCKERDETLEQLCRSISIKQLWVDNPDITWPVHSHIAGSPSKGFHFYVRDDAGKKAVFELNEIPEALRKSPHIKVGLDHAKRWERR